jgi:protocatechuate 3,4-dioxygenase alpha subunit
MSDAAKRTPSGSQTVGPYFRIGLECLIDAAQDMQADADRVVEIRGSVVDADGAAVPDAILEFWSADPALAAPDAASESTGLPGGFRRTATDENGEFAVVMPRPVALPFDDGRLQAPHMLVLVFARGLLRHLLTRVYLEGEAANSSDPVLLVVPAERRATLVARQEPGAPGCYRWDVILQGQDETVFFAW